MPEVDEPSTGDPDDEVAGDDDEAGEPPEAQSARGRIGSDLGGRRPGLRGRLGDSLISSLLDSGAAIKRGQHKVTELAGGTKEEIVRIVGAEVRGFLDKIDIVDLAQEVVSGLVIEVSAQVRFHRDRDGKLETEVSGERTRVRSGSGEPAARPPGKRHAEAARDRDEDG